MNISIIIITRNRADVLDDCLTSIVKQKESPKEVIVVDNASTDHTRSVIDKYKSILPVISIQEPQIGTPYARNAGVKIVEGDIVAFLDDDCVADPQWILSIMGFFKQHRAAVGVIGNTSVANDKSVTALVEFAYNRRWILTHIENPKTICKIYSGVVIDSKNAAFRLSFIKHFLFSTTAPFGDAGSNEDAELGFRMFQNNQNLFYNPTMKVSHNYSPTLSRLLWRNFWGGYADELLFLQNGIDLRSCISRLSIQAWISLCHNISKHLPAFQQVLFFLLVFVYPIFSRTGRIIATTAWRLRLSLPIPQR